ncbi:MAG TPA: CotH kinase family protein [Myxococcus sp.]|nr:CotH kinase family protein [Myxococcus sp.]
MCLLVACGSSSGSGGPSGDPGPADETPRPPPAVDSGQPPPGDPDGGVPDSGQPSGGPDAGAPDAGPQPTVCGPTAGPARWAREGEQVTATVTCATGHAAPGLRFAVDNLPRGASFDEATATLRWTPAGDQAAVWNLTLRERSTGETGTLKVGVATTIVSTDGKVKSVDPATYPEEYGLPVFHLSYGPDGLSAGGYRPARLVYRGRSYELEAKYRGATSSVFPKRSLTLKFPDEVLFSEPVFGDGFVNKKRLVLITTFNDNSYVRARLAFDLWNRMSPDHVRIHTFSAVVYANGRYMGVYTVADHVDKRLMAAHGVSKDADLFKAVDNNANFSRLRKHGGAKASLSEGLEKKEGTPEEGRPGAFDTMSELIGFVSDSDAAAFRAGFGQRMNTQDYADWWIFNTLILGLDSQAKNAYHAHDPATRGPWRFIPWDLDASFGQHFDTTRTSPTARPTFAEDNLLFQRMLAEPSIAAPMRERYRKLLRDELKLETVLSLIDGYQREIDPAARRDWARWEQQYRSFGAPGTIGEGNFPSWNKRQDFNTYEQELDYVRDWVRARWPALEGRLP